MDEGLEAALLIISVVIGIAALVYSASTKATPGERTPLHDSKSPANAKTLIDAGANINAKDQQGFTPLHHAVSLDQISFLIAKNADIHCRSFSGYTPLIYILRHYINNQLDEDTACDIVRLFVKNGFDLIKNYTALIDIIQKDYKKLAITLLFEGADPNFRDELNHYPLHYSQNELCRYLIGAGAIPNVQDYKGKTPLDYRKEIYFKTNNIYDKMTIDYLEKIEANPALIYQEKAWFASKKQEYFEQKAQSSTIRYSSETTFNIEDENYISDSNYKDEHLLKSQNPLKNENQITNKQSVIAKTSEPSELDKKTLLKELLNESDFWEEIENKEHHLISKLIELGDTSQLNRKNSEGSPLLHIMVRQKKLTELKKLLEAGADANNIDANGNTALHKAVIENAGLNFIKFLLNYSCNPLLKNSEGLSAYELAAQKENLIEKELILELLAS